MENTKYTDEQKTEAVKNCQSFNDLRDMIIEYGPFISNSREEPVIYDANELLKRIIMVTSLWSELNLITRAHGLREKVQELLKKI